MLLCLMQSEWKTRQRPERSITMRRNGLKLLSLLMTFILLIGSGAYASEELRETDENFFVSADPVYENLIDRVKRTSHGNSFTGSILLAAEDQVILYGGPKAMTTEGRPADMYTTYDIGSCSKTFTAVAVFQLIEAGMVSLDDPVTKYFPEYETGRDITVRRLLHMQSGIADYTNDPETFWGDTCRQDMDKFTYMFFNDKLSDEDFLQALYAAPLYYTAPGTDSDYSNTNYHLLAMIVEQVSGMQFNEYLREHIFVPCGMEHTTSMAVGDETSVPKQFSNLFSAGIVNENGYSPQPVTERGAGGIHTCVADLWAFDRALVSGQLVSGSSLEEMTNFETNYGCGLYSYGKNAYGHSGRNGTYTTENVIIDSEQFGRVYFIVATPTDAGTYGLDALTKLVNGI